MKSELDRLAKISKVKDLNVRKRGHPWNHFYTFPVTRS